MPIQSQMQAEQITPQPPAAETPLGQGLIFIIDDDEASRYLVVRTLKKAGYDTVEARSGEEGLRLLENQTPSMIILDVGLPDMSGYEVRRRIKSNRSTAAVPVLQVSAQFTSSTDRVEALEGGADVFLRTPVEPSELLAQVRAMLRIREAELECARSEQKFRSLFESIDDGLSIIEVIFDDLGKPVNYRFLEMNTMGRKHTGLKDPVGKTARELVPGLNDFWFETYGKVAQTGEAVRFESHAPAMHRWFDVYAFPLQRGTPKVALRFKDITKRKKAEQALKESEERFRHMANNAPVMIWVTEQDGSSSFLSESWYEFTGQTAETGLGFGWVNAVHPEDRDFARKIFMAASERQEGFRLHYRLRRRDGVYRWAIDSAAPRFAPEGEFLGFIGSVLDIHEAKQAEEQLRLAKEEAERSRAEQRAIFRSMTEGLVVFDPKGNLLEMNPAALAIHGFDRLESVQRHISDLAPVFELLDLDGNVVPVEQWPISCVLRGETFTSYEVRVRRTDGVKEWIGSYGGSLVRDAAGRVILAIITLRDVTALREAEAAVRNANEDLARLNAELEERVQERTSKLRETIAELEHFSYTITHDMRAPLRALQAFGEILREEYTENLDDTGRDYLRRIVASANRMDSLITDALNYSQVVRTELPLEPVDPGELLKGIIESYPQFQPPRVEVEILGNFPLVLGNQAGLTQCASNLLGNAVKFVQPGKLPHVRIWAEERGDKVRLWFEDNGIGIPPEQQQRVFVMFQRLSKNYEGTGVGLALVRKVVERMRGNVGVESAPGQGSRFWVELGKA
jgi:PAS domain S-box-containing protein